ncbi:endonuclease/exonuclease/phosphatase family protein [Flavobacteriaceae bacterium SZ-1-7]|uniref:endonuclease/exonuclease/phosphatase family protein n=1 Tax=Tamlana sedimenti TaxID=3134126 RepID=UPI003126643B
MLKKIIKGIYFIFNILVILLLLGIHFVVQEDSYWSSLYFYILPLPVIIFIVLLLSSFLVKLRKYNLILAVVLLVIWLGRSFKIHFPDKINDADVEIVFWNASRENGFSEAFNLNGGIPDVMVLSESSSLDLSALKKSYPDYYFYKSKEDLMVFSKNPIEDLKEESSRFRTYILFFKTMGKNICAIDVQGSSDVPRSWEFEFVNNQIKNEPNTIILGDFNVPYESKYLDSLKVNFNHAFNKKGNGFRETWFWNLPLLSLDHIWVSKDLKILKTEKIGTFKSDHSMVKTVVRK